MTRKIYVTKLERIQYLNKILLEEMPHYKEDAKTFPQNLKSQRQLLRSLMNVRPPAPINENFLREQDILLQDEKFENGIVTLEKISNGDKIIIWQGDITRLATDAIVNAANSALLGCFIPCHGCIDNAIHSAAGLQLRNSCANIIRQQGHEESVGQAKITPAFNLPCRYVIHTVGPFIDAGSEPTENQCELLKSCYKSCLKLAAKKNLESIAFCCISTGEFHFPNYKAAEIAIKTVSDWLNNGNSMTVVFNVFKDKDVEIYKKILGV
ncbi:MAG: protein-ADP-ribose hydrolase [Selenomonadaceae bacterium]|nr:protein-ADP-ribose hydrolase [Selenomonadaceae bacterium]